MRPITCLTVLVVTALAAQAAPVPTQFVDEWSALGAPLYGQQSVVLVPTAPAALKGELPVAAAGAQYAVFNLGGDKGATTPLVVALIEQAGKQALLVDSDGDGALAAAEVATVATPEQRPEGFGKAPQPVWLASIQKPQPRTVAFRLSAIPGMIVMAARGYATFDLAAAPAALKAYVVDANANLVLDEGVDALYADLNADGKLDGPGERATIGPAFDVADFVVEPKLGLPLAALTVAAAKAVDVPVRFAIGALKTKPLKLVASLQRQGGGGTLLDSLEQPVTLRTGSYTVESLSLGLTSAAGSGMFYNFERQGAGTALAVQADTSAALELVGPITLKPQWSLTDDAGAALKTAAPGAVLRCELDAVTATGMKLVGCNTGTVEENYPTRTPPRMELVSPAGKAVFTGAMEFG